MYVVLALVGFLVAEVWVISLVGEAVGGLATLGLLVLGLFLGVWMINAQSGRARDLLLTGASRDGMFPSLFGLLSGLLFIFPGFISDGLALALLLPPVRLFLMAALGSFLASRLIPRMQTYTFRRFGGPGHGARTGFEGTEAFRQAGRERRYQEGEPAGQSCDETIIEGEFRDVTAEVRSAQERSDGRDSLEEGGEGRKNAPLD